jgi:hypothetical protein
MPAILIEVHRVITSGNTELCEVPLCGGFCVQLLPFALDDLETSPPPQNPARRFVKAYIKLSTLKTKFVGILILNG